MMTKLPPLDSAAPEISARSFHLRSLLWLWLRRLRTRHHLRRLDDRLLADVGLTRVDRTEEERKPFWR